MAPSSVALPALLAVLANKSELASVRQEAMEALAYHPREQVPDFTLCAALLKKPNFDLVLEKATELGVDRIVPVLTRRSVVDKVNAERAMNRLWIRDLVVTRRRGAAW